MCLQACVCWLSPSLGDTECSFLPGGFSNRPYKARLLTGGDSNRPYRAGLLSGGAVSNLPYRAGLLSGGGVGNLPFSLPDSKEVRIVEGLKRPGNLGPNPAAPRESEFPGLEEFQRHCVCARTRALFVLSTQLTSLSRALFVLSTQLTHNKGDGSIMPTEATRDLRSPVFGSFI